jgi:hypothetical protein
MSGEKISGGPESTPKVEAHEAKEQLDKMAEKLKDSAEKERNKETSGERKSAREIAEKEAISGKEVAPGGSEKKSSKAPVHRSHKQMTYKATMRRVEGKLPAYQRTFSKVINNDTVDKVSNIASKTVARPSGLLGGGAVAFVALLIVTFYASRYGWEVSGSEFIVFMIAGWALGLLVEGVLKLVRR